MHDRFSHPLSPEDQQKLEALFTRLESGAPFMTGYPCNQAFDYSELAPLLEVAANNVGDPWVNSNYSMNTLDIEREVLQMYARWLYAPERNMWGYITGGGTEGNMYGLYLARELHPRGIVYYSQDTHYSVTKSIHVLGMRSIMIRSSKNGEMDYEDLRETIRLNRDKTPIIFANIGTTMKQAVDNLPSIHAVMEELAIGDYYLHADAAFTGGYFPFIDNPPPFDFRAGIHSISVSGHKFIGCPTPCGIALALRSNVERIGRHIEYIGAMDTTIPGSRSAVTPVILWYTLKRRGEEGMRQLAAYCLKNADYAVSKMQEAGIPAWRNPNALTVVFPRPGNQIIQKWSLAPQKQIAHLITVGHVTREIIDSIIADLVKDNAVRGMTQEK